MELKNKIKDLPLFLVISAVLFLLLLVFIVFSNKESELQKEIDNASIEILGNKDDLIDFSIKPLDNMKGEIIATGAVSGGYFFEGNILVNILNKDKKILRSGYGTAKTDWMTSGSVGFDTVLNFEDLSKGLGYIELMEDDPSGGEGGPVKKILIPIIINN